MYEVELCSDRRENTSLGHYLHTIGKYQLLTRDEEFALARRIRRGDKAALDQLVNANLRFSVSIAKKFLNQGLSYMDLIAEGNVGLITAAKRFDERRGFRFISYAVWWVRQAIQKALADQINTVRLPLNRTQQVRKMGRVQHRLEQARGRKAGEEEIAAALGLSPRKLRQIRAASRPVVSLNEPLQGSDHTLADELTDGEALNPEQGFVEDELRQELADALGVLNARERGIVRRYFGMDDEDASSLDAIGKELNLSRERVRQIRNQALAKLRHAVAHRQLGDFLH